MGIQDDFCMFFLPGAVISWGFFDIIPNATILVADITGDQSIQYDLILPVPQWVIFLKIALTNAYRSISVSLLMLPVGATVIYYGKGFVLSQISLPKTALILLIGNIFFGFFGLWAASFMNNVGEVRKVWMRILLPLWWIGGFNNSWEVAYKASPAFARWMLCNPIIYVLEGMRAAVLGQTGYLPYWKCVVMLSMFSAVFGLWAIHRLKRRLDCL